LTKPFDEYSSHIGLVESDEYAILGLAAPCPKTVVNPQAEVKFEAAASDDPAPPPGVPGETWLN